MSSIKTHHWALSIIGLCLGYTVAVLTRLPLWSLLPIAALWVAAGLKWKWADPASQLRYRKVWPWSLVPLVLGGLYVYLAASFGNVDLGAVFFHLQAGMSEHGGSGRTVAAVLYTLSMVALLFSVTWLVRRDQRWRRAERFLALVLLAANPLLYGLGQRSASIVTDDGAWLERRYTPPVLSEQENPPNLLLMYLESIERTYADERFGEAYTSLNKLGETGVVFEGIRQMDNTGWTMAGMIASQCGVPLMPAGLLHDSQFEPLSKVVPGVDCLGDLLAERGYQLSYLGGASTQFAGKGLFYRGHGFNRVQGREALEPQLDDPEYTNSWGIYDDSLYDFTVKEIRQLAAKDGPWGLVNLSITGHAPSGYPTRACRERQGEFDGQDILYSVECSSWLARNLIERLQTEGLLDNTLVVLMSDHLTMRVSVWDELVTMERDNTLIMLSDDLEPARIQRESSMLDVFPTLLDALGFTLEEGRAGLGVSLLGDSPATLVEKHGLEVVNERLQEETALQQRLWEGLAPKSRSSEEFPFDQMLETPADQADQIIITH
ncbi:sulfatase-like hydrolase/transferase [Halomonas sp. ZH2S]|uniref:Sulfatase-like hydrolase/transferase n=1 Tax=Vreelandella zhuhanensis TaxID=2684210 RepID=A0A7X3H278_9GAMM|nr:sulfatase-like hydrolase/transferase [Halomonas zhuhanensis]MWJ29180.1 sulfatase-like hydrolase/transferase [Halomonas zhuhanensis]